GFINNLQQELLKSGQHIPGFELEDAEDLVQTAHILASSEYSLKKLSPDFLKPLELSTAQMIPLNEGKVPAIIFEVESDVDTTLELELRISEKTGNYTPDVTLEKQTISVHSGRNTIKVEFSAQINEEGYAF